MTDIVERLDEARIESMLDPDRRGPMVVLLSDATEEIERLRATLDCEVLNRVIANKERNKLHAENEMLREQIKRNIEELEKIQAAIKRWGGTEAGVSLLSPFQRDNPLR